MPDLGPFSISLAVADLDRSRAFYEQLGFERLDGDDRTWVLLRHGTAKVGLFQGLFEGNALTFNPPDVRAVQRRLQHAGVALVLEADPDGVGPAHAMLADPDGNTILLDQLPAAGA